MPVRSDEGENLADLISPGVDSPAAEIVVIPLVAPTPTPAAVALLVASAGLTPTILSDPSTTDSPEGGAETDLLGSREVDGASRGTRLAVANEADVSGEARGREATRLQDNHPERAMAVGKALKPRDVEAPPVDAFGSAGSPARKTSVVSDLPSKDLPAAVSRKEKMPVTSGALTHAGEHASDRALERGRAFVPTTSAAGETPASEPVARVSAPRAANAPSLGTSKSVGSDRVALSEGDGVDPNVSPALGGSASSEPGSRAADSRAVTAVPVGTSKEVGSGLAAVREIDVIDPSVATMIQEQTPSRGVVVTHLPTWSAGATRPTPNGSLDAKASAENASQATEPAFEAGWHLGRFLGREEQTRFAHPVPALAVPSRNTAAGSPWITPQPAATVVSPPSFAGSLEQVPGLPAANTATSASPVAGNFGLTADVRAGAISGTVIAEKFAAGPAETLATAPGERGVSRNGYKKSSLDADQKRLRNGESALGTEAATRVSPMHQDFRAARAVPTSEESFSSVSAAAATSMVSGSIGRPSVMEPAETAVSSSAVQAIRRVMEAADSVWATERPGMDLKLKFDDVGVAVRVEYRDGAITAIFQADSAELRERLTAAWQVQAAGVADQKPYRLSDPVFTSPPSSSNSFSGGFSSAQDQSAGGDTARQFAQSRHSETANPLPGSPSMRSTTVPAPFAETRPAVLPGTNARLHAFA